MSEGSNLQSRLLIFDVIATLGWRIYASIFLSTLVAITEGLTISAILPLLSVIGLEPSEDGGRIASISRDLFLHLGMPYTIRSVASLLGILIFCSLFLFLLNARLSTSLQARYVANWQARLSRAMVSASWAHLRQVERGAFHSAMTVEASRLGAAFYQINLIATSLVFILVQGLIATLLAPAATFVLVSFGVFFFAVTRALASRASQDGQSLTTSNTELASRIVEIGAALKLVKATAREGHAMSILESAINRIQSASKRSAFDIQLTRAVFDYGGMLAIILMLVLGHEFGGYDVGSLIVVVAIFVRLFPKVTALRQCLQSIAVVLPAFFVCKSIVDDASASFEQVDVETGGGRLQSYPASIELIDVDVLSPDGSALLKDVSLKVNSGDYIAVVGPSGAGKSTLLDIMMGLVVPSSGTVLSNDRVLSSECIMDWRRGIGYLGQDPVLFSGTIFENIIWGRSDVDSSQVMDALRSAAADEIRANLSEGVGVGGNLLSGGERQRVGLARAIVGSPSLIILDEATSALDAETEKIILHSLRALKGSVTIIIVSHKLDSVKDADKIFVLSSGRVIQSGSFDELKSEPGWFRNFSISSEPMSSFHSGKGSR